MAPGKKGAKAAAASSGVVGGDGVTDIAKLDAVLPPPSDYVFHYSKEAKEPYLSKVMIWVILGGLYVLAFSTRLFAVVRYESVIHEFDPYFNYRTTQKLTENGWYEFYNWFDDRSWYPLGRHVGATVYPGLMMTSGVIHQALTWLHFDMDIRNICVFLAPIFAGNTALVTFFFTREIKGNAAGLCAAAFISIIPGYVSRSVAGSYDNEAIAIFAIVLTFFTWVKAVNTGSLLWSFCCVLAYFYMVLAWGGYIFLVNIIPLYVFLMVFLNRFSHRLYVAYSTFYVVGTMMSMQVQFVGFKGLQSGEHMPSAIVFVGLQVYTFMNFLKSQMSSKDFIKFVKLAATAGAGLLVLGALGGVVQPFTGRFYVLLDPSYAGAHIPIIASVSEHQPTPWSSLFFDLNVVLFLVPVGMFLMFRDLSDAGFFIILYGISAGYFAGIMVRLVLVFTPAACVLAGISLSELLRTYADYFYTATEPEEEKEGKEGGEKKEGKKDAPAPAKPANKGEENWVTSNAGVKSWVAGSAFAVVGSVFVCILSVFVSHCVWVTSEAYSSPSIVLQSRGHNGERVIIDDFREAYRWISQNTEDDAKIMSWWDYGYQLAAMSNRTTIVDNNTWNNTHIATVGRAMASSEEEAYKVMRKLDVTHVLVIFGGRLGYSSDDINKFLWMVKISAGVYPEHVQEKNFYNSQGQYKVDATASKTMLNSLMYKMCYYRFGDTKTRYGSPSGYDQVRQTEIGKKNIKFTRLEEAFTSENWIVRIYKVLPPHNRAAGP